jgi:hypothetical protein
MLTGRRLFQSKNDITKMRELLAAPILPPSAIDAMIPRELDRIVMKSLAIDPTDRFQSAADMAAEIERTLIAARYSSRELSKMLHALYLAGDDPLIVTDASDEKDALEHTIAITSTGTPPPAEHTRTTGRHAGQPGREETQTRMDGVLRAERSRLERLRWVARLKVTVIALVAAVALGAVAYAAKKYLPDLLRRPPQQVTPVIKNQDAPATAAPAAKPNAIPGKATRKRVPSTHKTKGHAPAAGTPEEPTEKPVEDAPMPPSTE